MKFWTDSTWQLIHMYCFLGKKQKEVIDMLYSLAKALPCSRCSHHMINYLNRFPPHQASNLFQWSVDFHNDVNKRIEKKELSYQEAKSVYLDQINLNTGCFYKPPSNKRFIILSVVLFVILLLLVYNREWIKTKLLNLKQNF